MDHDGHPVSSVSIEDATDLAKYLLADLYFARIVEDIHQEHNPVQSISAGSAFRFRFRRLKKECITIEFFTRSRM